MPYQLSETDVERTARVQARLVGCVLLKIQGVRGWPDRLLIGPSGQHMFMEFKKRGEGLRPLQEEIKCKLLKMGHLSVKVDNLEQFQTYLKGLLAKPGFPLSTSPEE